MPDLRVPSQPAGIRPDRARLRARAVVCLPERLSVALASRNEFGELLLLLSELVHGLAQPLAFA